MKKLLLLFILSTISLSAQERKTLYGTVSDSINAIRNVHVINMQTKQATYTDINGNFRIFAKIGDSLKVTSIQYDTKFYKVNKVSFGFNDLHIFIDKKVYELDEVHVKNTDLLGNLTSDINKTPRDKKAEALEKLMDFSKIDMTAPTKDDHIDKRVRPHIVESDPTKAFAGAGTSIGMPFKYSERLWALRRDLAFKKSFPAKILNNFGEQFFFEELKIPVERYYHFLEYCNPLGIENLYKKGNHLKVIEILKQEHVEYLKIINKQD